MSSRDSSEKSSDRVTDDKPDSVPNGTQKGSSGDVEKAKPSEDPMDGGFDAWLNVLGTHLVYISTWCDSAHMPMSRVVLTIIAGDSSLRMAHTRAITRRVSFKTILQQILHGRELCRRF